VLAPPVTGELAVYLAPPLAVGATFVWLAVTHSRQEAGGTAPPQPTSPLGLWSSLKMAIAFQAVLTALPFVQQWWGTTGVLASAVFLGATDMDALTFSMCRLAAGGEDGGLAAQAIAVGILSNTAVKLGLTLTVGSPEFRRRAAPGLAALALAIAAGVWLARMLT
jgi:uncharacterized membrane protein (DUF4010 family)